jgi:hypothetical protein
MWVDIILEDVIEDLDGSNIDCSSFTFDRAAN